MPVLLSHASRDASGAPNKAFTQTHAMATHCKPLLGCFRSVVGRYSIDAAMVLRVSHCARTGASCSQVGKGGRRARDEFAATPQVHSLGGSPHSAFDDRVVVHVGFINVPLTARSANSIQL